MIGEGKPSKREKQPPKGCKKYFFNVEGKFFTEEILENIVLPEEVQKSECVFICFAINDKNAVKKYNNWKNGSGRRRT